MSKFKFRGFNRIKFPSEKIGKTVFCQSLLLRDYLIHLEWDETVQSYELKPFKISVKVEGKRKTFQPHLLINHSDRQPTVVWLKSSVSDEASHNLAVKLISNFLQTKGFSFTVKTACEIRREPLFSNLKFLRRYVRCEITLMDSILCTEFFRSISKPHLRDLIHFFKDNNAVQTAYALLTHKIVEADIHNNSINYDLPVTLRQQFPSFNNGRLMV
jgi:hypothetical protein